MDSSLVASYALAIAGVVAIGYTGWTFHSTAVNQSEGNRMLLRLFAADNASRARKLCNAAPSSYFDAVGVAIDAALNEKSKDLVTIRAAIDSAFEAQASKLTDRSRALFERGLLAVMLALDDHTRRRNGRPAVLQARVQGLRSRAGIRRSHKARRVSDSGRHRFVLIRYSQCGRSRCPTGTFG